MTLWKRSGRYWADFSIDGTRYRKPLGTRKWQEVRKRERVMIEAARHGQLETQAGPKRLFEAVEAYLAQKAVVSSKRTVERERERLSLVKQHLGDVKHSTITPEAIAAYQHARHARGVANRTVNMDVGALRRVRKHCGRWRMLQDRVQNLPEDQVPIGRALTVKEQTRLFAVASRNLD